MHSTVTLKVAFEKLVVIFIWQKHRRDFGEKKSKRSSKKTDTKAFTFSTLKKKKNNSNNTQKI